MSFKIANHVVGGDGAKSVYVIAEIGQNHQGDIEIAKRMIAAAKLAGADCVKFQKSCLPEKFTKAALERRYDGPNSWGCTYGAHKEHLEFDLEQYKLLQHFAHEQNIAFTASAMDGQSLMDLVALDVPVIKIGSGDANNVPLLRQAAKLSQPLIISTGMQTQSMVDRIVDIMHDTRKTNYCLMHCVSSYPTAAENVQLRRLCEYRKRFPSVCIGYSGHELGISISMAAVAFGAKVIERHFTLDKQQKGTDHKLSLEPIVFQQLIAGIRSIETRLTHDIGFDFASCDDNDESVLEFLRPILNESESNDVKLALAPLVANGKYIQPCEMECRAKLGKSLVYRGNLKCGATLNEHDICVKVSEPFAISAEHFDQFVGNILIKNVCQDENLATEHFQN